MWAEEPVPIWGLLELTLATWLFGARTQVLESVLQTFIEHLLYTSHQARLWMFSAD